VKSRRKYLTGNNLDETANASNQRAAAQKLQRADVAPSKGYGLVVDGHFKTQYNSEAAASKAAAELLSLFPKLRIEIYDASTKVRTLVK